MMRLPTCQVPRVRCQALICGPLQRLVVAQDTGGAIRGVVRGDVFWGDGKAAAEIAGRMKHSGRTWVLLPRSVGMSPPRRGPGRP